MQAIVGFIAIPLWELSRFHCGFCRLFDVGFVVFSLWVL